MKYMKFTKESFNNLPIGTTLVLCKNKKDDFVKCKPYTKVGENKWVNGKRKISEISNEEAFKIFQNLNNDSSKKYFWF